MRSVAVLVAVALGGVPLAKAAPISGEILRFTGKRTGILVDLRGSVNLEPGASVRVDVDGKQRTGTVKKVTENGRAFIALNKGLPASVAVGDTVAMEVTSGATEDEASAKPDSVRLSSGGYAKAYWDEVSFLAAHRKAGTRTDVAVSYLNGSGNSKSTGGDIQDNTEYAVTDKHTNLRGDAGFVGLGGVGGGLLLTYDSSDRDISASNITTIATGTVDSDDKKETRSVTEVQPYLEVLSRAKTGDLGFGAGLGIPIQMISAERKVTLAGVPGDHSPATTTAYGAALEGLISANAWAVILQITPVLSGKTKQSGAADVTHKSSEFGAQLETYASRFKTRAGVVYASAKDGSATDNSLKFTARLDYGLRTVHLVPYVDYTTESRKNSDLNLSGTLTETDVGTRIAMGGVYAPFVSLGVNIKNENETQQGNLGVKTSIGGLRVAGGIDI